MNNALPPSDYILIVDDEADIIALHEIVVRVFFSGTIVTAESGKEALDKIQMLGDPMIIISDHKMPNGDGLFLFESLKVQGSRGHFILCTATPCAEVKAIYSECVTVIEKPRTAPELAKLIPVLLAQSNAKKS